jgi:hypothetical protein
MLNVDAPGISAGQVTHQLLKGRRVFERIDRKDLQEGLGFVF